MSKVVVVFECTPARATLSLFVATVAMHPATRREFTHTVLMCPGLILLAMFAIHWREYRPVGIVKVRGRPVVVFDIVGTEGW